MYWACVLLGGPRSSTVSGVARGEGDEAVRYLEVLGNSGHE
jgi:hypothetical protein